MVSLDKGPQRCPLAMTDEYTSRPLQVRYFSCYCSQTSEKMDGRRLDVELSFLGVLVCGALISEGLNLLHRMTQTLGTQEDVDSHGTCDS